MNQSRKYEKTYRVVVPEIPIKGKYTLEPAEAKALLNGTVTITEKMDGANCGIYIVNNGYYLQKRGGWMDESHEQFKFFQNKWQWYKHENILKLPKNTVVYGELMYCTHSIYYDQLPDYFLVFDVFDLESGRYQDWSTVKKIADNAGLQTVPLIGVFGSPSRTELYKLIPKVSAYGQTAEGIVIHNYPKQLRGKVVRAEFVKTLEESDHWANKEIRYNKLATQDLNTYSLIS